MGVSHLDSTGVHQNHTNFKSTMSQENLETVDIKNAGLGLSQPSCSTITAMTIQDFLDIINAQKEQNKNSPR